MKVRITNVSQVDQSGVMEINFDIISDDGDVLYPNNTTRGGTRTEIIDNMKRTAIDVKESIRQRDLLQAGQEFEV